VRQPAVLLIAAALIAGGAAVILAGGNVLRSKPDASGGAEVKEATAEGAAAPSQMPTVRPTPKEAPGRPAARSLAPFTQDTTDPAMGDDGLELAAPRAPLSDIGQALPPKPGQPEETLLFRPVATAAGILEAKGYRIAVAGIEPVGADETCDFQGQSWPCGMRARAAFRAWLRGRSISCELPPQADSNTVVTSCRVGKQDVAAWLVDSGWARAAAGPYTDSGNAAAKAGKGIFGAPPVMKAPALKSSESALPAPPASDGAILSAPISEPEFEPAAPMRPSDPLGAFPPAPAPPPARAQ
jgi:endonuclease YncB( thermonuclease family)